MQRSSFFFTQWLAAKLQRAPLASEVFSDFKKWAHDSDVGMMNILSSVSKTASTYQSFVDSENTSLEIFPTFIYRINAVSASVLIPLMFYLTDIDRPAIPDEQMRIAVASLESWIIRRHIVRAITTGNNRFIIDLIKELEASDRSHAGDTLKAILQRQEAQSSFWPSDEMIRGTLCNHVAYRSMKKSALRMILEAVEDYRRGYASSSPKHEQPLGRNTCTIEHVMPQKWSNNWADRPNRVFGFDRDNLVNFIGNLTLVTRSLNSSLSNAPWDGENGKRKALEASTSILLTREVLEMGANGWTDELILERSHLLTEDIIKIWPSPTSHKSEDYLNIKTPNTNRNTITRPPIAALIEAGFLSSGQTLYPASPKYAGRNCVISREGNFIIDGNIFTSPSAAGQAASRLGSTNGWDFWRTAPPLEKGQTLDDICKKYLEKLGRYTSYES